MKWSGVDTLLTLLLTLLATFLRLYMLGEVPPGFQFDEAFNAIDAQQVLAGNWPLFLPANAGREVLYTYWQAGLARAFGLNIVTLRLASALAGIAAVPLTYWMIRRLFQRYSMVLAFFTAFTLAISLWHIHFSHYGIRVILMPIIFTGTFAFLWLNQHAARRSTRYGALIACGVLLGTSVWTHPTGRLAPIVVVAFLCWTWLRHPGRRSRRLDSAMGALIGIGLLAALIFLPLGIEFYRHPDFFFGHASEVSVFADRVSGDSPWQELLSNILRVLEMFSVRGDLEWTHNLSGRPVFDVTMSCAFLVGVGFWIWRLLLQSKPDRQQDPDVDALFLLAVWSAVMLAPSVLSEAAPNYSRTLPALPAVFLANGLGLTALLRVRRPYPWLGVTLVFGILVYSSSSSVYDYFVVFAEREETYYLYDADKLDALEYLSSLTGSNHVYLSQLWGDKHATVHYLRGEAGIKSLDTADAVVLAPPGKGTVYAFPSEQHERADQIAQLWNLEGSTTIPDRFGRPLLYIVRVEPHDENAWPPKLMPTQVHRAEFDRAPTLLGMAASDPDKQVTLFWLAVGPMSRDLTSFVHLIDADGRRVAQVDRLPANGSYPTSAWQPGERVIDRYFPALLDPCAFGQDLQVQVGWYDLALGSELRARSDAPGTSALAGTLALPYFSYPVDQLEPQIVDKMDLTESLRLAGHAVYANDPQPGAPFIVDLFWTAYGQQAHLHGEHPIIVTLTRGDQSYELWQGQLAPGASWRDGQTVCRRLRVRVPQDLAPGTYAFTTYITVPTSPEPVRATFGQLAVAPTTREFSPPTLRKSVDGTLAETAGEPAALELTGLHTITRTLPENRTAVNDVLTVDLVWHARSAVQGNYKVYVHMLNESGEIVAQSDALPLSGYTTNRWIPGEYLIDPHQLALPAELDDTAYSLVVGMYDPISSHRLVATDNEGNRYANDSIPVATIQFPLE